MYRLLARGVCRKGTGFAPLTGGIGRRITIVTSKEQNMSMGRMEVCALSGRSHSLVTTDRMCG